MKLQTNIPFKREVNHQIDYTSKIVLLGSCFSKNMGHKFKYLKFISHQNPYGILFHTKAIETIIRNAVNQKKYSQKDIFLLDERWHCFEAHSQLSSPSKKHHIQQLNDASELTNKSLANSTHVIITLGTSWVYQLIESKKIVANCHKVPSQKFKKLILSVDDIIESLHSILSMVRKINPTVNFIFTVSPIRHVKDGFIENQQSKSHLISAIHEIIKSHEQTFYFPSYEMMMDELRDYRFYEEDMIHPNKTSINYIWDKFSENWFSDRAIEMMKEISKIKRAQEHKPFNATSEKHKSFLTEIKHKIESFNKKYPEITF